MLSTSSISDGSRDDLKLLANCILLKYMVDMAEIPVELPTGMVEKITEDVELNIRQGEYYTVNVCWVSASGYLLGKPSLSCCCALWPWGNCLWLVQKKPLYLKLSASFAYQHYVSESITFVQKMFRYFFIFYNVDWYEN